ncbi:MAG: phosphoribosyl-ATP diphosphatase, partial [Actinomycetota bacterium]|nr:phosphoribosyl-ATP diphosphatase [Actinomycetota bacterium]
HTGERTCFYRGELGPAPFEALPSLERTIAARHRDRPAGSYTTELFDEPFRIGEKVEEEALEVVHAHREETAERLAEESADLIYHLLVLLRDYGVEVREVEEVLNARRR